MSRRRPPRLVLVAAAVVIVLGSAALALGAVPGIGGGASETAAGRDEVRLDADSVPAGARRERDSGRRGGVVVQAVPPGGTRERKPAADDDSEPPERILRENARLRREVKHLKALEAQQRRVTRLLRRAGATYGPVLQGAGDLVWPVAGNVTSPFGQRWGRLHAGVDIGARTGTAIYAAQTGRVVISGPTGGYGNYICLAHTARFTTCYAHLSRFMTRRGEVVKQGEVIGLVGCTGHCFGDHLHFETRVGGRPVDPMNYL